MIQDRGLLQAFWQVLKRLKESCQPPACFWDRRCLWPDGCRSIAIANVFTNRVPQKSPKGFSWLVLAYWGLSSCSQIAITGAYFGYRVSVYIRFFSQVDPELISIHHKKLHIPSDQGGHASLKVQRASQQELCGSIVHGISVPKPTWHGAAKNEDDSSWKLPEIHTLLVSLSHLNQVLSRSSRSCQSLLKPLHFYHFWRIYTLSRCVCVCRLLVS